MGYCAISYLQETKGYINIKKKSSCTNPRKQNIGKIISVMCEEEGLSRDRINSIPEETKRVVIFSLWMQKVGQDFA